MNYENKYKELEGKIKKAYLYAQTDSTKAVLEDILPELKDNDERIRKELIRFIQMEVEDEIVGNKWLAWLEKKESVEEIVARCKDSWYNEGKIAGMAEGLTDDEKYQQGWHDAIEKKEERFDNANKVEPKFKVGDWLCENEPNNYARFIQILEIVNVLGKERYRISRDFHNDEDIVEFDFAEKYYHKFGIADAKDGDVLYSLDSKQPFIFKHRKTHEQAEVYCGINIYGKFFVGNTKDCIITTDKYIPATKEQRDKLLKAMADKGWQFDFEKKELKKVEQNSAWSEEDERIRKTSISFLKHYVDKGYENAVECIDWLKSLKDRVQPQLKHEWSEVEHLSTDLSEPQVIIEDHYTE